jgi:hypothetical protein
MRVTRRTAFLLSLTLFFSYEAYALFVRESGPTVNEPRELHLTREVNAETPLAQTFVMHADTLNGVEVFARGSDKPATGPLNVTISRKIGEEWAPLARASFDASLLDLSSRGSVIVMTPVVGDSGGSSFRVELVMPQTPRGQGLRFQAGGPTYEQGSMEMGGRPEWGDLRFRTRAERTTVFRNMRHYKREAPAILRYDAVWFVLLIVVNWAVATAIYFLAFAEDSPVGSRSPGSRRVGSSPIGSGAVGSGPIVTGGGGSGSAVTTAAQPRV